MDNDKKKKRIDEDILDINRTVLIVIDLQNDFCDYESVYPSPRNHNRNTARKIYSFVKEIESFDIEVLYFRQLYDRKKLTSRQRRYYARNLPSCKIGSKGAEYFEFSPPDEKIFTKYNYDIWQNETFEDYLDKRNINTLIIVGVDVLWCILYAVLGAAERGFYPIIPDELVSSFDDWLPEAKQMLSILSKTYTPVVSTKEITEKISTSCRGEKNENFPYC